MKIQVKTNTGVIEVETDSPYLKPSKCQGCGKEIYWAFTRNGKRMPISMLGNGEMVSHFFDCPKANKYRKTKVRGIETEQNVDDRVLCKRCKREFQGSDDLCPDCQGDIEDIF